MNNIKPIVSLSGFFKSNIQFTDKVLTALVTGDRFVSPRVTISDTLNNPSTQARQALTLLTLLTLSILKVNSRLRLLNRKEWARVLHLRFMVFI